MQYKAINDSVIIKIPEVKKETQRESGIFLIQPESNDAQTVIGTVVSVGEGKFDGLTGRHVPPCIEVGDRIITNLSTGISLDKTHRMIRTDDIFAVIK